MQGFDATPGSEVELALRQRALDLGRNPEVALRGQTTVSIETQASAFPTDFLTYIENHFGAFLKNIRFLSKEDQELLLGYFVVAKTQASLAGLHHSTQTLTGTRIRMAMQRMGTIILMGGPPTPELLAELFGAIGMEDTLPVPLSRIVVFYARTRPRSFQRVSEVCGLYRPDIRRAMSRATKALHERTDVRSQAMAAYMSDLGEFRVRVEDTAFASSVFAPRAER